MLDILWLHLITLQTIVVNNTAPCFQNYSAGAYIWQNCGLGQDYLKGSLVGWEWITGGYFSMVLVAIFATMTYIKYQKAIYPIIMGTAYLPISWFAFPDQFLSWAIIMSGVVIGILVWYVYVSQTNES